MSQPNQIIITLAIPVVQVEKVDDSDSEDLIEPLLYDEDEEDKKDEDEKDANDPITEAILQAANKVRKQEKEEEEKKEKMMELAKAEAEAKAEDNYSKDDAVDSKHSTCLNQSSIVIAQEQAALNFAKRLKVEKERRAAKVQQEADAKLAREIQKQLDDAAAAAKAQQEAEDFAIAQQFQKESNNDAGRYLQLLRFRE